MDEYKAWKRKALKAVRETLGTPCMSEASDCPLCVAFPKCRNCPCRGRGDCIGTPLFASVFHMTYDHKLRKGQTDCADCAENGMGRTLQLLYVLDAIKDGTIQPRFPKPKEAK